MGKLAPPQTTVVVPNPKRQPGAYVSYGKTLYEVIGDDPDDNINPKLWVVNAADDVTTDKKRWLTTAEVDWCVLQRPAPACPDEIPEQERV